MTPRDVPGPLDIHSLFPWLALLAPAATTPSAPHAAVPAAASPTSAADLPQAA